MFKRVGLFLVSNLAIIVVISILLSIFNIEPYLTPYGLNLQSLLIFSAIVGFTGAIFSLLISKWMAKMAYSIQIIEHPSSGTEKWLFQRVSRLSEQLGIGMPEIGIYESREPNAFATGWNRNSALVAVSTGLIEQMDENEMDGVLAHEMAHVANGDMVTMSLIQGVLNTFVIFFARVAAYIVSGFLRGGDREEGGGASGLAYFGIMIVFEILFGILASIIVMWFSRHREFRADAGAAAQVGKHKMIDALQKLQVLQQLPADARGKALSSLKISGYGNVMALFSTHPPLEKRIEALRNQL